MTRDIWPPHDAPFVREPASETECSGSASVGWTLHLVDGLILHPPRNKPFGSCVTQFLNIGAPPQSWVPARLDAYAAAESDHALSLGLISGWVSRPEGFLTFAEAPRPQFIVVDPQLDFLPIDSKCTSTK